MDRCGRLFRSAGVGVPGWLARCWLILQALRICDPVRDKIGSPLGEIVDLGFRQAAVAAVDLGERDEAGQRGARILVAASDPRPALRAKPHGFFEAIDPEFPQDLVVPRVDIEHRSKAAALQIVGGGIVVLHDQPDELLDMLVLSKTGAASSSPPPHTIGSHSPGMIRSGHTRMPARKPSSSLMSIGSLSSGRPASSFSSCFRRRGMLCMRRPVPRQELVDPIDRVIGDASENVAQLRLGIKAVELGGFDQGVDGGGALAAGVGAGEEIILAAEGERPDGAFGGVVVDLQAPVVADSG